MSIELKESGFREWHDNLNGIPALGVEEALIDGTFVVEKGG